MGRKVTVQSDPARILLNGKKPIDLEAVADLLRGPKGRVIDPDSVDDFANWFGLTFISKISAVTSVGIVYYQEHLMNRFLPDFHVQHEVTRYRPAAHITYTERFIGYGGLISFGDSSLFQIASWMRGFAQTYFFCYDDIHAKMRANLGDSCAMLLSQAFKRNIQQGFA